MAALTIRNVDDATKAALRIRAAQHGVSMEEEARRILREALSRAGTPTQLDADMRTNQSKCALPDTRPDRSFRFSYVGRRRKSLPRFGKAAFGVLVAPISVYA